MKIITMLLVLFSANWIGAQSEVLFGSYWNGSRERFMSLDLQTGEYSVIRILPGVTLLSIGQSTYDPVNERYFNSTNLGILEIDSQTGIILNTIPNPDNVKGLEYDVVSGKIYGTYWTGSQERFVSLDLSTQTFTLISTLPGVHTLSIGITTFDATNGRYIIDTNLGITIVDTQTGAILNTIANPDNVKGLEYDEGTGNVYGSYWMGSRERFVSLDLSTETFTFIRILTGVTLLSTGTSTFDSDNGRYFVITNLGVTVVDSQTGIILNTIANPNNMKLIEYGISTTPLPVEVESFNVSVFNKQQVAIKWKTSSERDNDYFVVEKSVDALDWEAVQKVDGAGNSMASLEYKVLDESPYSGLSFYRLKQTNFDRKSTYSPVQSVSVEKQNSLTTIQVFPNPTTDRISLIGENAGEAFDFYNLAGENVTAAIRVIERDAKQVLIDVSQLEAGVYLVNTSDGVRTICKD